ncbi:hypothetical protein SK128_019871 [Halocaridina rubra]|uniref:Uncharacterized protein n=1 Tax=Halocaridina rubra TaxID=373956 RepID=A0AAN8ZUB5_HALRR
MEGSFEQGGNAAQYSEHLENMVAFKAAIAKKSFDESVDILERSKTSTQLIPSAFDDLRNEARKSNETFKYWDTFITLATIFENLIRSDREGNRQEASGKSQTKREDKQRQCVIEIANASGRSMKELLEFDLTSTYVFSDQGLLAKGSKSALINEVAKKHANYDGKVLDYSKNMRFWYIADVMVNARKITTKEFTKLGDFSGTIVDSIQKFAEDAD